MQNDRTHTVKNWIGKSNTDYKVAVENENGKRPHLFENGKKSKIIFKL